MNVAIIKQRIFALLLPGLLLTACDDQWDDHYEAGQQGSDQTIYQMLCENPDLTTFRQMVDIAGYADMLNSTQTFTVWAPVNSALETIDLDDKALVQRTVLNHIARFNQSSANTDEAGIRMMNGKKFRFDDGDFGGVSLLSSDNLCRNGVLHTMTEAIPYTFNIREYIDNHDETSMIAEFLARFDEEVFDLENSVPIDVNANGETVYDSVKIQTNWLLDYPRLGIGPVADEDSVFTMVVPTDAAWRKAYDEIKPWFVTGNDSITDVQTSLAIFSNMVFRADLTSPTAYSKLVSTTGCEIFDIDPIFATASYMPASNGSIWLADVMGQNPLESWNPALEIESEIAYTRKMDAASKSYSSTYTVAADSPFADEISELSYIYVSSSSLDNPVVEFTINNPLSGTYEIYAYFVPAVVDNPSATDDITRVSFTVSHPASATSSRPRNVNFTDPMFITSATEVTKMYVGKVTFPVSHYVDRMRQMDDSYDASLDKSPFSIKVRTNVSQGEFNAGTYKRSFRIDRVVLVPVI